MARPDRDRPAGVRARPRPDRPRVPRALRRLLQPAAAVAETIALVGLDGKDDRQATSLSGGERRRLDFALALIGDPELIFLDEPTTGFDPSARRTAWDVIENLRDLGKTIFLTTHYMDEAERLADRIAVIVGGHIVAQGTPDTLGGRDRDTSTITFTLPAGITADALPATLGELARRRPAQTASIALHSDAPLAHLALLAAWAANERTRARRTSKSHDQPSKTPISGSPKATPKETPSEPHPPRTAIRFDTTSGDTSSTSNTSATRSRRLDPVRLVAPPNPLRPAQLHAATNRPASRPSHCRSSCSSRSSASAAATRPSSRTARRSAPQSSSSQA